MHPTAGRNVFDCVTDGNAVAQHRRAGGQVKQRDFVTLWHTLAQNQPGRQHHPRCQATVVANDCDIVVLMHA